MAKTALEKAEATLGALSLDELRALQKTIAQLVALKEGVERNPYSSSNGHVNGNGHGAHGDGYIEYKMVNGCGPYAYQRTVQYEGGKRKLKSKYLGKAT